jgi:hypothetical protein
MFSIFHGVFTESSIRVKVWTVMFLRMFLFHYGVNQVQIFAIRHQSGSRVGNRFAITFYNRIGD